MPCRYDPTEAEIEAAREKKFALQTKPMREALDRLTHENDVLREALLALRPYTLVKTLSGIIKKVDDDQWSNIFDEERDQIVGAFEAYLEELGIPSDVWDKIQEDQVEHRKEDLRRLEKTFNDKLADLYKSGRRWDGFKEERNTLFDRLRKVEEADPDKPLAPQLGFDPDDF